MERCSNRGCFQMWGVKGVGYCFPSLPTPNPHLLDRPKISRQTEPCQKFGTFVILSQYKSHISRHGRDI